MWAIKTVPVVIGHFAPCVTKPTVHRDRESPPKIRRLNFAGDTNSG